MNTHRKINSFWPFSLSGSAQESPQIFKTISESFSGCNLNVCLRCALIKINFSNRSDTPVKSDRNVFLPHCNFVPCFEVTFQGAPGGISCIAQP